MATWRPLIHKTPGRDFQRVEEEMEILDSLVPFFDNEGTPHITVEKHINTHKMAMDAFDDWLDECHTAGLITGRERERIFACLQLSTIY